MPTDDNTQHWKLGFFYYNPDEPRLFVQKRSWRPFTLNFAKPAAWAITTIIVAIVITLAVHNN